MVAFRTLALRQERGVVARGWSVDELAAASRTDSTKRAYESSLRSFAAWCRLRRESSLPASPQLVAEYFADLASEGKSFSTIERARSAIDVAHRLSGYNAPGREVRVKEVLRGIARRVGAPPQQKRPLVTSELRSVLEHLPADLKGLRDRALLLLGFATAARRSELVALEVGDLTFGADGLEVRIRRSKTDQESVGEVLGVPFGVHPETCPVRAVQAWLKAAGIVDGAVFRSVSRHGHLGERALSGKAVARVIKERVEAAGLNPDAYAGHSLRAGFITQAVLAGVKEREVQRQSRHRSIAVLRQYVRHASVLQNCAAGRVGL